MEATQTAAKADLVIDELMAIDPAAKRETCFVYGRLGWVRELYYDVELMHRGRSKPVRFLQANVKYDQDSPDTALIEIPKCLVLPLELSSFVLDDKDVARRREHVAIYNSPKVIRNVVKQPERVGNYRI